MCLLCFGLTGEDHWTDVMLGTEPPSVLRVRRRKLVTAILAAQGLAYRDDPGGLTSTVSDRKGSTRVVRGLGELWTAAEHLCHERLDPLDSAFLARLLEARA